MKQGRHEGQRISIPVGAAMVCRRSSGSVGRGGGARPVEPSATCTRQRASAAVSGPPVPSRHVTARQGRLLGIASAVMEAVAGMAVCHDRPRPGVAATILTSARNIFSIRGIPAAQTSSRAESARRKAALIPWPASGSTVPKRMPGAQTRPSS